ncbi:MAG: hypothetical protein WC655_13780, partial [Candidatus Hydrogenedentales bacterium]
YKYAFLKTSGAPAEQLAAAKKRVDEVFEGVYRCQRVTGVRGLQARGYFLGHGPVYEERVGSKRSNEWHQGEVDGQPLRWRADPSHHNYSDAIHGLGQYYDLAAEGEQKDRCRDAIDALVSYWVDNGLVIYNLGHVRPEPILGFTDGKTINTRIMMAIGGAKVAYHATGKEKFKAVYDKLVTDYGVRGLKSFEAERDYDDAEHVFSHLENLFRLEDDPALLAGYRVVADGLWANHKNDAQSLFTYLYYAVAPDAPDKDKAMKEALYSLQTFPTDMTVRPRMNSLRKDLKPPYPTYLAAWDNEYIWKENLLKPDGWQSRLVTDVAVSSEDPSVIFAIDDIGGLYISTDAASSERGWTPIDQALRSPVRAVEAGSKSRIVYVACDEGFYVTTTEGTTWQRMPVPPDSGTPRDVLVDPANPNAVFAVTSNGVYRSRDFGSEFAGQSWESLTEGVPTGAMTFKVAPGAGGRVYALYKETLLTRTLADATWTRGGSTGLGYYTEAYPWLSVNPANPDHIVMGAKTHFGGVDVSTLLLQSKDAGTTWDNTRDSVYQKYLKGGFAAVAPMFIQGEIAAPVFAGANGDAMFAGGEHGALKSIDGGVTWQEKTAGFDIPLARTLLAPRNSAWVFSGTPAGLYLSKDGGETWQDGHLCLQFTKNERRELGGASFADAFWRARYHGFIDDAAAASAYGGK